MYCSNKLDYNNKEAFYEELISLLEGLMYEEPDAIANLANASALLYDQLPTINWAGFYLYKEEQLVLGPFQGKPACIRIPLGRGVCGTAAQQKETVLVQDVHQFPGHIACDAASNSEIVVPILYEGRLLGVLDIDSPIVERFDAVDQRFLEILVSRIGQQSIWE